MKSNLPTISPWKSVLFSIILFFCALSSSYALDVTLEWDANTQPDIAAYKIYYDTDTGEPYSPVQADYADQGASPIIVAIGNLSDPNNPEYVLTGLTDGTTYFFVVTALDNEGLGSELSNEVCTAGYLKVTGTASMTAGTENELTITAYDAYGNVATGYSGDMTLTFTGLANAPDGASPTVEGTGISSVSVHFTNGVSDSNAATLLAYRAETTTLDVSDGLINSYGDVPYDLDLTVTEGPLEYVRIEDASGGTGSEVTTHGMSADDAFQLWAAGYDGYGNYREDVSVEWSGTGVCSGNLSPTSDTTTTFTAVAAGEGTIVADHATATDDATGTITVSAGQAASFVVTTEHSGTEQAGTAFSVILTAKDADNNTATGYGDTKAITWSWGANNSPNDTEPTRPADGSVSFSAGVATVLGFTLVNSGETPTITASDGIIQGTSDAITVISAAADGLHTSISQVLPDVATAGGSITVTITAYDQYQNLITTGGYTVFIQVSGANTVTPAVTDNGNGTYSASYTPTASGTDTITGTINGTAIGRDAEGNSDGTYHLTVNPTTASYFKVTGTATMAAGTENELTITAYDAYDNVATGYSGDMTLIFSGANVSPGGNNPTCDDIDFGSDTSVTFSAGQGTSTMKLYKAETAHVKATQGSITTSDTGDLNVTVSAAGKSKLLWVDQPSSPVTAGEVWNAFTIEVTDLWGNRTAGTNNITVSPSTGPFGGTYTKAASAGLATFDDITYNAADTITVTGSSGSLADTPASNDVVVTPKGASTLVVAGITDPIGAGTAVNVTVTAKDEFGNIDTNYIGTIAFTSSDGSAVLPRNYTFVAGDNGEKTFTNEVTLKTVGEQSVTATDIITPAITGSQTAITVIPASISEIVFLTPAQTVNAGEASAVMTVQTQDEYSNPAHVSSDTTINLSSTSANGKFSLSASPWEDVTSVTISKVSNSANFYYKDTIAGTPTITAAESPDKGWTDATQQETVVAAADLIITKTDSPDPGTAGGDLTYKVTVTNNGPSDAIDVTLTDTLPVGVIFVSVTSSQGDCSGTSSVTCNLGTINNGNNATVRIVVTPMEQGEITNQASVTGTETDPNKANNTVTQDTTINHGADLKIQKTVDDLTPDVGDNVTFTITGENNGPSTATNVKVTDMLQSGLTYKSSMPSEGTTYDYNSGIWDIDNLTSGETATLNITATVNQSGRVVNIASLTDSDVNDLDSSDNSSGLILNGGSQADLGIEKRLDNGTPNVGENIIFTITVANNGPNDATGIQVTDLLPVGLSYVDNDSGGSYDSDTEIWDIGNLDVGASATLQLTATVDSTDEKISIASITHIDQIDPDATNNESSAVINPDTLKHPSIADLAIQKTVNQSEVNVGDEVVFTLVVRNNGPDDANNVQITDVLPDGVSYASDDPSVGSYNSVTGVWAIDAIPAASYVMMDIAAEVTDKELQTNTISIDGLDEFDPNNGNDSGEAIVTGLAADLSVEKLVDNLIPILGDTVAFTVTITNNGPNDATGVEVTDLLPSGLTYHTDTPSQGTYDPETGVWIVGTLASGAYASLDIVSTGDQPGDITNTATRTASSPPDTNSDNDIGSITITIPVDGDADGIPDEWEIANGLDPTIDDSDQDPDDDGLANIGEYQNGTDPNSVDTDTDNMPDGWEVTYGLDPLIDDSAGDLDNDGYTNLEEYLYGTKPNDSNSKLQPPTADAGPDQTVDEGVTVTLDGSNSSDPDDDGIASYLWEQTDGSSVTLDDPSAVQPTFTSPNVGPDGESLTFQLTVTDYTGLEASDTCIVNVTWDNDPPSADAGPDQTVDEGVTVTLDGSNSSDPDDGIHRYLWTQTVGPSVTLDDPSAVQPTFTSPNVGPDGESLTFQLTVTDYTGLEASDTCIVNVTWDNDPPSADAGPDQTVDEGVTVTLDGSNSSDPDDEIHRYLWTQTVGPSITLSDATAVQPTFVTPSVGPDGISLEFLLAVTDNGGLQHTDVVSIDIVDNGITDFPDDVVPTQSFTGSHIGFQEGSGGNITSFVSIDPASVPDTANMPDDLVYGLIDMQLKSDTVGGTVTVTIHLEDPAPLGYAWYKYGPNNGWYDYSDHAEFNADRDQVTLTLVDGGIGDDDGVANGVIVDPSGLGSAPTSYSTTSGDPGCFIDTAAFCSNRDRSVKSLSQFRDKWLADNHRGQSFITLYNKFSLPITGFLGRHRLARAAVRYGLIPITRVAYVALYVHPVVLLLCFILLLLTGVYCSRRFHLSPQHGLSYLRGRQSSQ